MSIMSRSPKYDVIIIGAGLVGLATGLRLLQKKPRWKIALVEKEGDIAQHQSSHNSGVIHSGVYYTPGSLKAQNCIRGYRQLVDFCRKYEVDHEICGKVIVATRPKEIPPLEQVFENGKANGLKNLKWLEGPEIQKYEPYVRGLKAIYVPQSGIVDFMAVARQYARLIQEKEGDIYTNQPVTDVQTMTGHNEVITTHRTFTTRYVINCAGLYSDKLAQMTQSQLNLQILPFRGEYYQLRPGRKHLVKNLIYPAPDPDFPWLGVHFTRRVNKQVEAGPNAVLAYQREGYSHSDVDLRELKEIFQYKGFRKMALKYWNVGMEEHYRSLLKPAFTQALQQLIPSIRMGDLEPGGTGVRALACSPEGELIDDYVIYQNGTVINVCNAPSPAATSSLSIGQYISERLLEAAS
jgi:L-2-hydroxyglutarate oxidase